MAEPVITSVKFRENPSSPRRVVLGRRNRFDVFGENFTRDNVALILVGLFGDFDVRWTRTRVRFIDSGHLDCDSRPDVGVPPGTSLPSPPADDDGDITVTVTNNDGPSPPFTDTVDYTTIPFVDPGDGKPGEYGRATAPLPKITSVKFKELANPKKVILSKENRFEITGENFTDAGLAVTMTGTLDDGKPVHWAVKSKTKESGTLIRGKAKPTKEGKSGGGSGALPDDPGDLTVTVSNNAGPSPPFPETVDYVTQPRPPITNGEAGSPDKRRRKKTV